MTRDWWELRRAEFDLYLSELVIQEIRAGDEGLANRRPDVLTDVPILPVRDEMLDLATDLVREGPLPRKASADAAHIAIATIYACEYLLTWNCPACALRRS